jgi:hypothetical protein
MTSPSLASAPSCRHPAPPLPATVESSAVSSTDFATGNEARALVAFRPAFTAERLALAGGA